MMIVDRILPNLTFSVKRFLLDQEYEIASGVQSGAGTLVDHFPAVAIVPGFPDDLTRLSAPTIGIVTPMAISSTDDLYGEIAGVDQILLIDLWGFVVARGKDVFSKQYRDRLLNDVFWLFDRIGRREGLTLYDETDRSEIGQLEVAAVRGRLVPPTGVGVVQTEAERYRFHVAVDVAYTGDAGQEDE